MLAREKRGINAPSTAYCCGPAMTNAFINAFGGLPSHSWPGSGMCLSFSERYFSQACATSLSSSNNQFYLMNSPISVAIQTVSRNAGASFRNILIAQFDNSLEDDSEISPRGAIRQSNVLHMACVLHGNSGSFIQLLCPDRKIDVTLNIPDLHERLDILDNIPH